MAQEQPMEGQAMNQQDLTPGQMTPEQARAALESTPTLGNTARDRRIHGLATAAFGALVGGYVGLYQALPEGNSARNVITAFYVLLLFGLAAWQTKNIRLWPRHSKVTGYVALGCTVMLAGIGTMALNFLESRTGVRAEVSPLWYAVAAIVIAAPMLVAGWIIANRRS
jgi:hypothetical protein